MRLLLLLISLLVLCTVKTDVADLKKANILPIEIHEKDNEKEETERKDREEWINLMHKASPETNWKQIELSNKIEKNKYRKSGTLKTDSVAAFLTGKWEEIGSNNQSGRIMVSEFDYANRQIYCASAGGNIWKAKLDELKWEVLNDHFKLINIRFLKLITNDENTRMLISCSSTGYDGFFYSDDECKTLTKAIGLSEIADGGKILRTVITHQNIIYILALEWNNIGQKRISIYKSDDLGVSFAKTIDLPPEQFPNEEKVDIWASENINSNLYVFGNSRLYKLNNTKLELIGGTDDISGKIILLGFISSTDTVFYVASSQSGQTSIYVSENAGEGWSYKSDISESPFSTNSFNVDPTNYKNLYFGGIQCYRSHNIGESWYMINEWSEYYTQTEDKLHADIPSINTFHFNDTSFVFVSTDGGLYISIDSLKNVRNLSLDHHNLSQYYSVYTSRVNTSFIHAGSQDQGYQRSNASNSTFPYDFEQIISGDYGHIVSSDFGESIWMVYPAFVIYFPDIINSKSSIIEHFDFSGQLWMPPLMSDPNSSDAVYIGGGSYSEGAKIIHVTKQRNNLSFSPLSYNFTNSPDGFITALAHSPVNSEYWYVINSEGQFFYSNDAGENWIMSLGFNAPGHHYFYGSSILPSKKTLGRIYIAGSGYSNPAVYASDDNGASFYEFSEGLPSTLVYEIDSDSDDKVLFAATESGSYACNIETGEWNDISNEQAPDQTYWSIDFVENINIARFATYGRGIWDYSYLPESSIDELKTEIVTSKVYPNPSKGDFRIAFSEITTWPKQVYIYDYSGKLIENKQLYYAFPAVCDISLNDITPGIYLIKVVSSGNMEVTKILVQ